MTARGGLVLAMTWLAGCGGDSETSEQKYYRLKEINRFVIDAVTDKPTQTARQAFTYTGTATPDQVLYYGGPGVNALWGDADDVLAYYTACAFSGKAETANSVLDLETELQLGLSDLYAARPEVAATVARDDAAAACAANYNGQGKLVMKVFNGPGANGIWRDADDAVLYTVTWKQPVSVADASVQVEAPGLAGYPGSTLVNYYYSAGGGAERDLVRAGAYIQYSFDTAGRLSRLSRLLHGSSPQSWPGPRADDVRQSYTNYTYQAGLLLKCTRNDAGQAQSAENNAYADNFLSQRQYLTAGVDGQFCTTDDRIGKLDAFSFESL